MKNRMDELVLIYGISDVYPQKSRAFKQLQLQDTVIIPEIKPDIEQIVSVSIKVEITKTYIIATPLGCSLEGQLLTGNKLIVEGKVRLKVEYVAALPLQPIHGAHFCIPFSSYIVLGKDIDCQPKHEVTGYIEDVYIKLLDDRKAFINILLLLNAVPLSKI